MLQPTNPPTPTLPNHPTANHPIDPYSDSESNCFNSLGPQVAQRSAIVFSALPDDQILRKATDELLPALAERGDGAVMGGRLSPF